MTTLMTRRQQEARRRAPKKHRFQPYQRSSKTCTAVKKKHQSFPRLSTEPSVDKSMFPRPSSMSGSIGSEPECDTDEHNDVPSPAVYVDILTTTTTVAPRNSTESRSTVPSPTPTPLTKVTTSSSRHPETDPKSCISILDVLDGGEYVVQSFMEEGGYGTVARAFKTSTRDTVAIKILKKRHDYEQVAEQEVNMLRKLKVLDPDACGVVRFYGGFVHKGFRCLVFESLDVDLLGFLNDRGPLSMMEMRPVIQQLAVALRALKGIGLIHTDIKLENIMVVNQQEHPLKVKLIDFGLAVPVSEAGRRRIKPILAYRAPEVFLGLPLTEALDMWSLGCVMANGMLTGDIFHGDTEYEVLQSILLTLGKSVQALVDAGLNTHGAEIRSLEEVFESLRGDAHGTADAFMDLLRRMLQLDPEDRITPEQVLVHPFITAKPSPTKPPRRSNLQVHVTARNVLAEEDFVLRDDLSA